MWIQAWYIFEHRNEEIQIIFEISTKMEKFPIYIEYINSIFDWNYGYNFLA